MIHIKPGRVPSRMGFIGSLIAIIFGIFWLILANSLFVSGGESGSPQHLFFMFFGAIFIIAGIINAIYSYKNAFGQKRISEYDIVDPSEEKNFDTLSEDRKLLSGSFNYCPYCGNPIERTFSFCPGCGKKLKK